MKNIFGFLGNEADKWLGNIESQMGLIQKENIEIRRNSKNTYDLIDRLDKKIQGWEDIAKNYECARRELQRLETEKRRLQDDVSSLTRQLNERNVAVKHLENDRQDLKNKLTQREKEYREALGRKEEEKNEAVAAASRKARNEIGGFFETYGELYRHFMDSEWALNDTAMKYLCGENYVTFYALCGNEEIVTQFYDELEWVIGRADKSYVEMADRLLDFCVCVCSRINRSEYSRQEVQEGNKFDYGEYKICGSVDGEKVCHVVLRGIMKDGHTLRGSYVERGM